MAVGWKLRREAGLRTGWAARGRTVGHRPSWYRGGWPEDDWWADADALQPRRPGAWLWRPHPDRPGGLCAACGRSVLAADGCLPLPLTDRCAHGRGHTSAVHSITRRRP